MVQGAVPHGALSTSCADSECAAGLKCSAGTVTPTLPTASFVPTPGHLAAAQKPPTRDKAKAQIPQILAQVSFTPLKVYVATVPLLVFAAPSSHPRVCHCSSALCPASFGGAGT